MKNRNKLLPFILLFCLIYSSCKIPATTIKSNLKSMPSSFANTSDTLSSAKIKWTDFFADKYLSNLIDTAIKNNLEALIVSQEIKIAQNDLRLRKGLLFPKVNLGAGAGVEKVGRYTSAGAGDASTEMTPGQMVPEVLNDFSIGFHASWEADIWGKLRNVKRASYARYLASVEARNFYITNLVAEVANAYYELLSLDNQLSIINTNIQLQENGLQIVKVQKEASMVTDLAVKQFEAQLFNSQSLAFETIQNIASTENEINALLGRFPQHISRADINLTEITPLSLNAGLPSQMLNNRPDIKQAEFDLIAAKCDLKVARMEFYPSLGIGAAMGLQAFKKSYLFTTPESIAYSLIGDLSAPAINRSAIKAEFRNADARQIQMLYQYQKVTLNAFVEVSNELSNIKNLSEAVRLKSNEVETLNQAVKVANDLFKAARANYLEILMAQKEALVAKLDLVEMKKKQFNAMTNMYRALGGGWN